MKRIPHPIQYQGSKRNLAQAILNYFPDGVNKLIEPFAGSAAISIAAAKNNLANLYVINDLNKPLVKLLNSIVEVPDKTALAYEEIWHEQHNRERYTDSVEHYYAIREEFNHSQDHNLFLYLLARCVKGAVRYNSDGLFNQSPDKRRHGTVPSTMRSNIYGVSFLLKNRVIFSCEDYKDVLMRAEKTDLVYMDPPYQGVCGERDSRYFSGILRDDFVHSLEELNLKDISYIVSYDGRRGDKKFGESLPATLGLFCVELHAGRSSQSTLLGREEVTYESLYISPALMEKISNRKIKNDYIKINQGALFDPRYSHV